MFEDITIGLLWLATTWFVANIFIGIANGLREANDQLQEQLIKRLDQIVHRVEIEQQDQVYYWYDQDNRNFLAQGQTMEEIVTILKHRFPDHIFYIEKSNHLLSAKHNWEPVEASIRVDQ